MCENLCWKHGISKTTTTKRFFLDFLSLFISPYSANRKLIFWYCICFQCCLCTTHYVQKKTINEPYVIAIVQLLIPKNSVKIYSWRLKNDKPLNIEVGTVCSWKEERYIFQLRWQVNLSEIIWNLNWSGISYGKTIEF